MIRKFPEKLFVTGTGTGVGKTVISTILVSGLNASYWKPIQSGLGEQTDTEFVEKFSKTTGQIIPESYRLHTPISPHASAKNDGIVIDLDSITLPQCQGNLIVEGAGGVFVPLNETQLVIDLIKKHYNAAEVSIDYHRRRVEMDLVINDKDYDPKTVNLYIPTLHMNLWFRDLRDFLKSCIDSDPKSLAFYASLLRSIKAKDKQLITA